MDLINKNLEIGELSPVAFNRDLTMTLVLHWLRPVGFLRPALVRLVWVLLFAVFVAPSVRVRAQENPDSVLVGTIDTHIHTEEEYAILDGGSMDIIELARRARDKGMRAIVVKSLKFETATRAYIARKQVPGIAIYGGISLDLSVGGANPEAVSALAKMKLPTMKVVWMPVFDSRAGVERSGQNRPFARISEGGKLLPNVLATLDTIARHGYSVATSHLGADEALLVVRAARARNIPVVVTHAAQDPVSMTLEQMKEVVRLGGFIEHTALGTFKGPQTHLLNPFYRNQRRITYDQTVEFIRALGAEQTILATDFGQSFSPLPPDGFKGFILSLKERGITDAEIDTMTRRNPARFLRLPATEPRTPANRR